MTGQTGRFGTDGGAIIDLATREVATGGGTVRLEPKAAAVLSRLIAANGAVVSRLDLLDGCWGDGSGSDEALTQAVAQLRRAFADDPRAPGYIGTTPRTGYRWLGGTPVPITTAPATRPVRLSWRWAAALIGVVAVSGAAGGAVVVATRAKVEPVVVEETIIRKRMPDGSVVTRTSRAGPPAG